MAGPSAVVSPTPLPRVKAYLIGLILLSNGFSSMVIFPFVAFMVHDFFPKYTDDELGYKVGLLGSAYFLGSFMGSMLWGWLADRIGRRPCLLCGVCGTIFAVLLFGFSTSFAQAVTARLLWGLLNGNIGVAKTMMAEICDDTNQARGMALIAAQGGFGRLIGPVLGGFLARRTGTGVALLDHHPYALPCMVGALLALLALVGASLLLTETLPRAQVQSPRVVALELVRGVTGAACRAWACCCGQARSRLPVRRGPRPRARSRVRLRRYSRVSVGAKTGETDPDAAAEAEADAAADAEADAAVRAGAGARAGASAGHHGSRPSRLRLVLQDRTVLVAVSLYAIIGFYQIVVQELTPLWALNDAAHGGLSFGPSDIGLVITLLAPFQIGAQLFLYAPTVRRTGYRRLYFLTLLTSVVFCALMPSASVLAGVSSRAARIVGVAVLQLGIMVPLFFSFTTVFVLINNAASRANRGAVNGVAQSLVALTRMVGPSLGGAIFAWSESNGLQWPLSYHFMWYICALAGLGACALSRVLPERVERKRAEVDEPDEASEAGEVGGAGGGRGASDNDDRVPEASARAPAVQVQLQRLQSVAPQRNPMLVPSSARHSQCQSV
eukprot:g6963.t1